MRPVVAVVLPLAVIAGGLAAYFLVPLDTNLRTGILVSDILAAGILAVALRRQAR